MGSGSQSSPATRLSAAPFCLSPISMVADELRENRQAQPPDPPNPLDSKKLPIFAVLVTSLRPR